MTLLNSIIYRWSDIIDYPSAYSEKIPTTQIKNIFRIMEAEYFDTLTTRGYYSLNYFCEEINFITL